MKRVGIYCRVSTTDQTNENQLLDLRRYCADRGWSVYKEYIDTGISGAKQSRPALDQLMLDARKRRFDVIIVWRFDRFARSTSHLLTALEEFSTLGVDFCSFNESIDTSTATGKLIFTVISAIAELERGIIKERVRAGVRRAVAQGKTLGRPKLTLNPQEVRALREKGLSMRAIAKQLNVSRTSICDILKSPLSENPLQNGPVSSHEIQGLTRTA